MSDVAIRLEGVSKEYRIGLRKGGYKTARETIVDAFVSPFRRAGKLLRGQATGAAELDESFWALSDVSFSIKQGEVVGVIGTNGAGKSTLLKLLSRITEPTKGSIEIHGTLSSLLEVGTGFHPELTGRENIYLNGAILGMRRSEIELKLDEIVKFAEVEKFINTPVKHYSSGMYLRLAFSVAAHLDPEILLVDEVLAVGDAAFQKKCMGKMGEEARNGKTVLLVSHNMGAIGELCESTIWLESGRVRQVGPTKEVISNYLCASVKTNASWERPKDLAATSKINFFSVSLLNSQQVQTSVFDYHSWVAVELIYWIPDSISGCSIYCRFKNAEGIYVADSGDKDSTNLSAGIRKAGKYKTVCKIPGGLLRHGTYYLEFGAVKEGVGLIERFQDEITFEVSEVGCPAIDGRRGVISPRWEWTVDYEGSLLSERSLMCG